MKRWWAVLAMIALCAWPLGCAPKWRVVSQAEPNPLVGARELHVLPVTYDRLMVGKKTEQEFLADKQPEAVESFAMDKADMARKFQELLIAEARNRGVKVLAMGEPRRFVLRPHIGFMEPGFYAVVVSKPSKVILRLKIEDEGGKLLDEVEFEHRTPANTWANVASGSRYREDAEQIGKLVAMYLESRVSPR